MRNLKIASIVFWRFLLRYSKIVSLILAAILVVTFGLIKAHDRLFKTTLSEGIVGTYTQDNLPSVVTNLISQGLVGVDSKGEPVPNLVTGWQVNKDATEYTFKLKKGLRWLDGTLVRAQDISVPLSDVQTSAIDDQTIKFKLSDSYSPFPTLLTKPILKAGTNIGIGPYKIDSISKNDIFVSMIRLSSTDPSLPNLVIRFYPNEKTAEEALRLGDTESFLEANELNGFTNDHAFEVFSRVNHTRLVTIFYNDSDAVLSDKNFRLALSFAAPSIKGQEEAITSIPQSSWAFNPTVLDYLDNPAQAKTSLAKVKNSKDATIVLTATAPLADVGRQVVEAWNKVGIKAVLKVESGIPQNFQALLISQDIPIDPDQYSLWHSTQTQTNISKYSSPRVDKDLEDGRKLVDQAQRKAQYQDFQKSLLDDSPATFLYFPKYNVIALRKIDTPLRRVLNFQLSDISI